MEDRLTIRTPEQVGFQYVLAGVGSRVAAFLVDTLIRWLIVLAIFALVALLHGSLPALDLSGRIAELSKTWLIALAALAYGLVDLGYFLVFEALWNGQTPGKKRQRLRVIRISGQPIGWLESAIRNILRAVDLVAGFYPVGLLVVFLSRNNQRIGDYAAGTVVIVEQAPVVPGGGKPFPEHRILTEPEIEWYVSQLTPSQYQILRSFLERRGQMEQGHRHDLARVLCHRLFKPIPQSGRINLSYEAFIEEIVLRYEQRRRAV